MKTETRSTMPTGWSWLCPCGWSTGRHLDLAETEHRRDSHRRWHNETDRRAEKASA
jgi:hypothetical protein